MGILEDILAELVKMNAGGGNAGTATTKTETKKEPAKAATAKGPTLEDVQNKIRELVADDEGNAPKIKAATASLGGKRAGDFEGDAVKLKKLMALLEGMGGEATDDSGDDDLL